MIQIAKIYRFKIVVLLFCFMAFLGKGFSNNLSDKQTAIIYNEAIKLLQMYQQVSNQMADNVFNLDELGKTSQTYVDLFVSRKAIIYNDLDPLYRLSETYELETYVSNLLLWYPDGMKINLNFQNLKAGNIISHGDNIYTVDVMATKSLNGNYLNRQNNKNTVELLIRIAFYQNNKSFENFKIAGIRSLESTSSADDSKILAEVKGINLSAREMQTIKDQAKNLLTDYINFLSLTANPNETKDDKHYYKHYFIGLFTDSTLNLANDIEPDPILRWIPVSTYFLNLSSNYPEGIRNIGMNIDSAEFSKIIPLENNKYYISCYVEKFFSGKFLGKTIFRDYSKFEFRISFDIENNSFKNFKITSVEKLGLNLYNEDETISKPIIPSKRITAFQRKGFYSSFAMAIGIAQLNDKNLNNNNTLTWQTSSRSSLQFEGKAIWYLSNQVGLSTGLGYSQNSIAMNLSGNFRNNLYFTDINNETYLMNVSASYDSVLYINHIQIPLTVLIHSNKKPENFGIYFETGIKANINVKSNYNASGNFATYGYYEQYPQALQIINAPELGFVTRNNINTKGSASVSNIIWTANASIGISWPIDFFTMLHLGPEINFTLNSISNRTHFSDAFGNQSKAKKVEILNYRIKLSINHKF
jgi:hypothetical protein